MTRTIVVRNTRDVNNKLKKLTWLKWGIRIICVLLIALVIRTLLTSIIPEEDVNIIDGEVNYENMNGKVIDLDGVWNFYSNQFISPTDLNSIHKSTKVIVPLALEHNNQPDKNLSNVKYGTYKMDINTGDDGVFYGASFTYMNYAYRIFVNGEEYHGKGKVGKTREEMIPETGKNVLYFPSKNGKIEILIQISNFHHRSSGITASVKFADQATMLTYASASLFRFSIIAGYLLAFFVSLISIYFFYSKQKLFLYFALTCLMIFVRQMLITEYIAYYILPNMTATIGLIAEYISFYLGVLFLFLFFTELFPKAIPKRLIQAILIVTMLFCLSVFVLDSRVYTQLLVSYDIVTGVDILLIIYGMIRELRVSEDKRKIVLWGLGFLMLAWAGINDMLYTAQILPNVFTRGDQVPVGLIIFVLLNMLIVIMHFYELSEKQKKFSEELEEKVEERTSELQLMTEEANKARMIAESATKVKNQFLANMSHEIRTPMNAIIGMSELLLSEDLSLRQFGYVNDIKISSSSLLGIINDILDLSKIEAGKLNLIPIHYHFPLLVDNVASIMSFAVQGKENVEFILEVPVNYMPICLYGDDVRLRQILVNILGNAIKFIKSGHVKFKVMIHEDKIQFDIEDTGRGIKAEDIAHLFRPFEQADTKKNRQVVGTGLGLSITKNLVEMMDGHISIDSEYGVGSTFHIEIPLILGDETQLTNQEDIFEFIYAPEANILLVDDNEINLHVGAGLLKLCSIDCDMAFSGKEALEKVLEKDYDLVFMDHMMPEMDGIEATTVIRSFGEKYKELPIIALTANAVAGAREMFLSAGMNDFLSKPIDKILLNQILAKWLPKEKVSVKRERKGDLKQGYTDKLQLATNVTGLNVELGLERVQGMQDVYEQSLVLVNRKLPQLCEEMQLFLKIELNKFAISVHGIKGSFANIGAMYISEQAGKLEEAAKANDFEFCQEYFPPLLEQLEEFRRQLDSIFKEEATLRPQGDKELLHTTLEGIYSALDGFDDTSARKELDKLKKFTFGEEIDAELTCISEAMDSFDYERSLEITNNLLVKNIRDEE